MDILVTGFGPFPHVRVNPTTRLARAVADRLVRAGLDAQSLVLETSYAGGLPTLRAQIETGRPRAILMLGLAARARFVRVELFARGNASRLHPDISGATPGAPEAASGPLPARTTASAKMALAMLRQNGISARLSPSAGRYLCDACHAAALAATRGSGVPVIFIHVPWLRPDPGQRPARQIAGFRPGREALVAALSEMGVALARDGRAVHLKTAQESRHAI